MTRRAPPSARCLFLAGPGLAAGPRRSTIASGRCASRREAVETWRCFESVGQALKAAARSREAPRTASRARPDEPGIHLALGRMRATRGAPDAESLVRGAVDGYVSRRDTFGEIEARIALATFLVYRGRWPEAETELAERQGVSRHESRDATRRAQAGIMEAFLARGKGDYGRAWTALESVESDLFPSGPPNLRSLWLDHRAYLAWATGRLDEAIVAYRALGDVLRELGDRSREAIQRADTLVLMSEVNAPAAERRAAAREAREAAHGQWKPDRRGPGPRLPRRGLRAGRSGSALRRSGRRSRGRRMIPRSSVWRCARRRSRPFGWTKRRRSGTSTRLGRSRRRSAASTTWPAPRSSGAGCAGPSVRGTTHWRASLAALSAAEATRDLQPDSLTRARRFAQWARPYYELAGHLLAGDLLPPGAAPSEEDIELAYVTTERMRSRVLLDELDAARASALLFATGPLGKRRDDVLQEIARIQRQLLKADLPEASRAELLRALARAELDEATLRGEMVAGGPVLRSPPKPHLPDASPAPGLPRRGRGSARLHPGRVRNGGTHLGRGLLDPRRLAQRRTRPSPDGHARERARSLADSRAHRVARGRRAGWSRPALRRSPEGALGRSSARHPPDRNRPGPDSARASIRPPARIRRGADRRRALRGRDGAVRDGLVEGAAGSTGARTFVRSGLCRSRAAGGRSRRQGRSRPRLGVLGRVVARVAPAERGPRAVAPWNGWAAAGGSSSEPTPPRPRSRRHGSRTTVSSTSPRTRSSTTRTPSGTAILLAPGNDKEDGLLQLREIVNLRLGGRIVVLSGLPERLGHRPRRRRRR